MCAEGKRRCWEKETRKENQPHTMGWCSGAISVSLNVISTQPAPTRSNRPTRHLGWRATGSSGNTGSELRAQIDDAGFFFFFIILFWSLWVNKTSSPILTVGTCICWPVLGACQAFPQSSWHLSDLWMGWNGVQRARTCLCPTTLGTRSPAALWRCRDQTGTRCSPGAKSLRRERDSEETLCSLESTTQMQEPLAHGQLGDPEWFSGKEQRPRVQAGLDAKPRSQLVRDRTWIPTPGLFSICSSESSKEPGSKSEEWSEMQPQLWAKRMLLCPHIQTGKMPDREWNQSDRCMSDCPLKNMQIQIWCARNCQMCLSSL